MKKRKNYISRFTGNILDNIPSWMKLHDPESNGFPLLNVAGQELERIDEQFNEGFNDLFVKNANINQLRELFIIDTREKFNKPSIEGSGKFGNFNIKVVDNEFDFFNGRPTRFEYDRTVLLSGIISGVISGLYNVNYFNTFTSGYYYLIADNYPVNPSSVVIYNEGFDPINYLTYASGRMEFDDAGFYEIIDPPDSGYLISKYPLYRSVVSGSPDGLIGYRKEPHYEPQASSGWDNTWFYDEEGELQYHFTRLNNPFGSGTYNLSSGWLLQSPIEGTLKIFDILNLKSGLPVEIPSTGINIYQYVSPSGDFKYIGYDNPVPYDYDGYGGQTASLLTTTTWFQGRTSGYLDNDVPPNSGTFRYIQGTGELTNVVWFNNPISKYMAKYDYAKFRYLNDITTDTRYNHNVDLLPANPYVLSEPNNYNGHEVNWKFSKSGTSGIIVDSEIVRPGRDVDMTVNVVDIHEKTWVNPSGSVFTLNLFRNNLGFTQEIFDKNYKNIVN